MSHKKESTAEKIAVMQAFLDGEKIERKNLIRRPHCWFRTSIPAWNWAEFDYRVEPKPQELYLVFNDCGRVIQTTYSLQTAQATVEAQLPTPAYYKKFREVIDE